MSKKGQNVSKGIEMKKNVSKNKLTSKDDKYFENLKKREEWLKTYKMTALEHGHAPVTRRDFLDAGLITMAATVTMPSIFTLMARDVQAQEAGGCPTAAAGQDLMPAFVNLHLSGGSNLSGNTVPLNAARQLLPSYNNIGMGDNQVPTVIEFGCLWNAASDVLAGINQTTSAATRANTRLVTCPVRNNNDGGGRDNQFDCTGLVSQAGLVGQNLPNIFGAPDGGANQVTSFARLAPPPNLSVDRVADLTSAVNATGTLTRLSQAQRTDLYRTIDRLSEAQTRQLASLSGGAALQTLTGCATKKSVELAGATPPSLDARDDANLSGIWGINANSADNDDNVILASITSAVLAGNAGSCMMALGGYDYHRGRTRPESNAKDLESGIAMGRILESAALRQRKTFFFVITNGANGSNSLDRQTDWTAADRSDKGTVWFFVYDPAGPPDVSDFQIGQFNDQQAVDNTFITGGSSEMAGLGVFANYLQYAGKLDMFQQLVPNTFTTAQLNDIVKLG